MTQVAKILNHKENQMSARSPQFQQTTFTCRLSKGLQLKKSLQKHNRFAVLDPEFPKRQTHVFNEQARKETKGPMEGGRSYYQEDPRGWIILAPYVLCIQFTCKGLHMSLALGSS